MPVAAPHFSDFPGSFPEPLDGQPRDVKIFVSLGNGVKVARMALNHLVGVRIPVPQF